MQIRRDRKPFNDWLRSQLPAGCRVVRFPPAFLLSLWPFVIDDPRNAGAILPTLTEGPYPRALTNRFVADFLARGDTPEAAAARFLDMDVSGYEDLDRLHALSQGRLRLIERDCDLALSGFIEETFRHQRLFLVSGHPAGPLIAELVRMMVEAIGVKPSVAVDALLQRLRAFRGLGAYDAPVHPAVASHFKLTWTDGLAYRHYAEGSFSHDEFVRRYARFAYTRDYYEALQLLDEGRFKDAIAPLERAVAANPGSAPFHLSLCDATAHLHDPGRLAAVARRGVEACPDDGALWLRYAQACFDIGDEATALHAVDQALAKGADPVEAWRLRAWCLGRAGRRDEADAAARASSWHRSQEAPPRPLVEPLGGEFGRWWIGYGRNGV